jgi:hypothetical protein
MIFLRQKLRRLMYHVRRVLRLSIAHKVLLFEAIALLALARLAVLLFPFRWVARVLGKQDAETPPQDNPAHALQIRRIGAIVYKTSQNVPWTSKCLDQALAAKIMLAFRRIASTIYFGVKNDEQGSLAAHAWLRSGTIYVTGGDIRDHFSIIKKFA